MESKIEKLCRFASKYFNVDERELYSEGRKSNCVMARHVLWYYLHCELGFSAGELSKEFLKDRRTIFLGISKIKNGIKRQRYYRDIYDSFVEEYNKKATL